MTGADRFCEMLKLLRSDAMSSRQLAEEIGAGEDRTMARLKDMEARGLLCSGVGPKSPRGSPPTVFWVSPQWGGTYQKESK